MTLRALTSLFAAAVVVAMPVASAFAQVAQSDAPQIVFEAEAHDFGVIRYGGNGNATTRFKNTGKSSLIITNIKSSCGCLAVNWPKDPVHPGNWAEITFRYDTSRPGPFTKTFTVTSNAGARPAAVIRVKGTVETAPATANGSLAPKIP